MNWSWTKQRERAASLAADDYLTDFEISRQVKCSQKTLTLWKAEPEFQSRVAEHVALWRKRILLKGLAIKENRIGSYVKDFEATEIILRERGRQIAQDRDTQAEEGDETQGANYAGGAKTGFIVKDYKGKDADRAVFAYDSALMKDRLAIRKQIAQELGQMEAGMLDRIGDIPAFVVQVTPIRTEDPEAPDGDS